MYAPLVTIGGAFVVSNMYWWYKVQTPSVCKTYPPLVFALLLVKVLVGAALGFPRGGKGFNLLHAEKTFSVGFYFVTFESVSR